MSRRFRDVINDIEDNDDEQGYRFDWFGNNRHICDVLQDMRKVHETRNFSGLMGLVEEAQSMAYRMEAALRDQKDLIKLQEELSNARRAYKDLEKRYKTLSSKVKVSKPRSKV